MFSNVLNVPFKRENFVSIAPIARVHLSAPLLRTSGAKVTGVCVPILAWSLRESCVRLAPEVVLQVGLQLVLGSLINAEGTANEVFELLTSNTIHLYPNNIPFSFLATLRSFVSSYGCLPLRRVDPAINGLAAVDEFWQIHTCSYAVIRSKYPMRPDAYSSITQTNYSIDGVYEIRGAFMRQHLLIVRVDVWLRRSCGLGGRRESGYRCRPFAR